MGIGGIRVLGRCSSGGKHYLFITLLQFWSICEQFAHFVVSFYYYFSLLCSICFHPYTPLMMHNFIIRSYNMQPCIIFIDTYHMGGGCPLDTLTLCCMKWAG